MEEHDWKGFLKETYEPVDNPVLWGLGWLVVYVLGCGVLAFLFSE